MAARTAVVAGTATAVSGRVQRRQQNKYAAEDQQYVQQVTEPLQYDAPAEPDYTAELEQLAQLKAQGILTEDEFQAKKKQILGI
jgi:hypothetical protein